MTTETPRWFTSSYSNNGGACVEVATNLAPTHGTVPVRDSKRPAGPVLDLPVPAFAVFLRCVKGDGFVSV
ncbi:DUF397 domain-containing protein [Streptomyces sp. CS081A]|uniref:DUF397 domain-containing protein n=1 Tax=Streptomyces sp. CS081A TaxID=2162709 RepID=UPI000D520058|nr:DUF397 domain-containing protein [Streptomyces sp. CS081A]PVC70606.1 DUF397 domain-containing protein [Streptomyces sp. CS081A]